MANSGDSNEGNTSNSGSGKAILNTDGRYFNQAMQQLDSNWSLPRMGVDKVTWRDWCVDECVQISRALGGQEVKIGIDPNLVSFKVVTAINKLIEEKVRKASASPEGGNPRVSLVPIQRNLIDEIWGRFEDVPQRIQNELLLLDYKYHGEVFMSKRDRVVQELHKLMTTNRDSLSLQSHWMRSRGFSICVVPISSTTQCLTPTSSK